METTVLNGAALAGLALGAALLGGERQRRVSAAGLVILGLALAAWRAGSPAGSTPTPAGRLGTGFLVVNGGLLVVGMALAAAAVVGASAGPLRRLAQVLVLAGVLLLGWSCAGFLQAAGWRAVGAALGLGLAGACAALGWRRLASGRIGRRLSRTLAPPPLAPMMPRRPGRHALLLALAAGAAAAGLAPHLAPMYLGLVVAAWAGYFLFHPDGCRPIPVSPVLTVVLLPAYWLLAIVAGPVGLSAGALSQVPLSPAAELLVSAPLLLAAWAVAGLWPLHRQLPGALLAPVGALLLVRAALPLVSEGLSYWRPLSVPLLAFGVWHAAAHARWALVLAGAGFLGVAGVTEPGPSGGLLLLAAGAVLEVASGRTPSTPVTAAVRVAAWPAATWGALLVLEGGLRGEVVYTALGALGTALVVASGGGTTERGMLDTR